MLTVRAGVLDVAYERHGTPGGPPVVLLHGFPYDVRCYDEVVRLLPEADVVVPYLRGYGPTAFAGPEVPRSGQQAAIGHDLLELIAALGLDRPVVAGFDWGGRAACVAAVVSPSSVRGLVSCGGYAVQDIARAASTPADPAFERTYWYQWYLHTDRGRAGLAANRRAYTRLLWSDWSPTWAFTDADFDATAASFDNPDFVDVVVHSYRHRYAAAPGDPAYAPTEALLAARPPIEVPTVVLDPTRSPFGSPGAPADHRERFPHLVDARIVDVGHNVPAEAPADFAEAVRQLL